MGNISSFLSRSLKYLPKESQAALNNDPVKLKGVLNTDMFDPTDDKQVSFCLLICDSVYIILIAYLRKSLALL